MEGLRQAVLRRQLQIAEGRMKLPRLTTGEAVNLQKQILDLTEQLRELPSFRLPACSTNKLSLRGQ